MASTVERAAVTALADWLASKLPDVRVLDGWLDGDAALPERAITILCVGTAEDEWTTPRKEGEKLIHDALPAELGVDTATIVDTATANAALNTIRTAYLAHLADTDAHAAADATNTLTAPAASNLATGIALGNELRTKLPLHEAAAGTGAPHPAADTLNAPTAPAATNEATLVALAKNLAESFAQHLSARVYLWFLGARVQPVQLDIWTHYEAAREELLGSLEQYLRAGSADYDVFEDGAPVGLGLSVSLGADWPDASAAFDFDSPDRVDGDVQANEWRATYEGKADVPMLVWAQTARLARARVAMTVNDTVGTEVQVDWGSSGPVTTLVSD